MLFTDRVIATWKELCLDVTGTEAAREIGEFWAAAIGGTYRPGGTPDYPGTVLAGPEGSTIELCPVPEPQTVKHRVHLDIYAPSIEELTARGASVLVPPEQSGKSWTVMRDPAGGEFCAFLREPDELPDYRLHGVGIDCVDSVGVAAWWSDVLGAPVTDNVAADGARFSTLESVPGCPITTLDFAQVPPEEVKTVKNRIHWDVHGRVDDLLAAGATRLWETPRWVVLADPEGNEFCCFEPV